MTAMIDDEVLSPERVDDPYPYFAELREHDPVHYNEKYRAWFIHRYDDVLAALKDFDRFSSDRIRPVFNTKLTDAQRAERGPIYDILGEWIVFRDPPDHTRLRKLVSRAFTPRAVESWRPRIHAVLDQMLDEVADRRDVEFIHDFAYPIPAVIVAEMLGVPPADHDRFKGWSDDLMVLVFGARGLDDRRARATQGLKDMSAYIEGMIREFRKKPADNLISALIQAQEGGDELSDHEIVANCVLFLFGGHETTTNLIGNGTLMLLRHPHELAKLRAEPDLIKPAVEEILRYDGPSKMEVRRAADAIDVRGKTIGAGDMVYLVQAAANRDPSVFADPDRFDIEREPNQHIGFGFGIHFCLGASIARLEGNIVLDALIKRFAKIELTGDPEWIPTMLSRGMSKLPLRLSA